MEITLSLDKPCLYPGEVVKCTVQVRVQIRPGQEWGRCNEGQLLQVACNDPSIGSGRLDVAVECYGSERIDPGWVGLLYRPDVPAIKDGRVSGNDTVDIVRFTLLLVPWHQVEGWFGMQSCLLLLTVNLNLWLEGTRLLVQV